MRKEQGNGEGFDELFIEEFSSMDIDWNKVETFIEKAGIEANPDEDFLLDLGVGETLNSGFVLNVAGILFFSKEPKKYLRQNVVSCIRYQGNNKVSVIDRKDFSSDLLSAVNEAETFVKKNTRIASKIVGFKRVDVEEHPYEAVREAIINAVSHRDYSFDKTHVFVNIFDDRIEVFSPGPIPHGLRLREVQGKSFPRNYLIHSLFEKVHFVERSGSGLGRMEILMEKHGLKKPFYEAGKASFQVTFFGPRDKILDLIKDSRVTDLRGLGLNERQIKVLNYLQEKGGLARSSIQEFLGTTKKTVTRDLNRLIKKGFVKREGVSKSAKYGLVK